MINEIKFYRTNEPYGFLSNFARYPVEYKGKLWPTSEHAFQAQKFKDEKLQEKIRLAPTPSLAAQIGRDRNNPLRQDWDEYKLNIMYEIVSEKFKQHEDIKFKLLETNHAELIEHTKNDSYWGDGGDGSGKNILGFILGVVRTSLLGDFLQANYSQLYDEYPFLTTMVRFVDGVIRFKENKAVVFIYDNSKLNDLWSKYFQKEIPLYDIKSFYMEIGYSLSGFTDIFYNKRYPVGPTNEDC